VGPSDVGNAGKIKKRPVKETKEPQKSKCFQSMQ
jgi:hypothetical protein